MRDRLWSYALFAALLACAGLPIYIHAPKFYVDEYGVSLSALGAVLFGLRLLDVVQDRCWGVCQNGFVISGGRLLGSPVQ